MKNILSQSLIYFTWDSSSSFDKIFIPTSY